MLKRQPSRRARRGSTLLEFALVVPILLAMLIGIIEFGFPFKNHLTVANAVREGARAAALGRSTAAIQARIESGAVGVPGVPQDLSVTMQRDNGSDADGYNYDIPLGDNCSGSDCKNDAPSGAMIRIHARVPHRTLTGLFPFLNNRPTETDVTMRREG